MPEEYVTKKEFDRLQSTVDLLMDTLKDLKAKVDTNALAPQAPVQPQPVEFKKGKDPMSWSHAVPQTMQEQGPNIQMPSQKELDSHTVKDESFKNANRNAGRW
jgi:hypothetical protein